LQYHDTGCTDRAYFLPIGTLALDATLFCAEEENTTLNYHSLNNTLHYIPAPQACALTECRIRQVLRIPCRDNPAPP
jgi:hypothetical protein